MRNQRETTGPGACPCRKKKHVELFLCKFACVHTCMCCGSDAMPAPGCPCNCIYAREAPRTLAAAVPPAHRNPRDDAAQVSADGVQAVLLDGTVVVDNQVGGVALQKIALYAVSFATQQPLCACRERVLRLSLHVRVYARSWAPARQVHGGSGSSAAPHLQALRQRAVALGVGLQPLRLLDVVAQSVLGSLAAAATARAAGRIHGSQSQIAARWLSTCKLPTVCQAATPNSAVPRVHILLVDFDRVVGGLATKPHCCCFAIQAGALLRSTERYYCSAAAGCWRWGPATHDEEGGRITWEARRTPRRGPQVR